MKTKTMKCGELGTLEYRLPNIPEAMTLLGKMGLNSQMLSDSNWMQENELIFTAKLIEELGMFITKVNIKIDEKKISDYSEVLEHFAMIEYLSLVAGKVFESLNVNNKKKS